MAISSEEIIETRKLAEEVYHVSLGRLMQFFAQFESELNRVLCHFVIRVAREAGLVATSKRGAVAENLIQSVSAGKRFSVIKDELRRCFRISKTPKPVQYGVDHILNQMSEIGWLRDRLAHNGANYYDGVGIESWFRSCNLSVVRELDKWEFVFFQPKALVFAANDLMEAANDIERIIVQANPQSDQLDQELSDLISPFLKTWQYKPSELVRRKPRPLSIPQ